MLDSSVGPLPSWASSPAKSSPLVARATNGPLPICGFDPNRRLELKACPCLDVYLIMLLQRYRSAPPPLPRTRPDRGSLPATRTYSWRSAQVNMQTAGHAGRPEGTVVPGPPARESMSGLTRRKLSCSALLGQEDYAFSACGPGSRGKQAFWPLCVGRKVGMRRAVSRRRVSSRCSRCASPPIRRVVLDELSGETRLGVIVVFLRSSVVSYVESKL